MAQKMEAVSPSTYRTARLALLAKEKELTRAKDALNAARQALPVVQLDKEYSFDSIDSNGNPKRLSSLDLFDGRRQLLIYHFMFDQNSDAGCSSCSWFADNFPTDLRHLYAKNTSFVVVSRAPIEKIILFQKRMGWTQFPWVSSLGSDFNYDFHVTLDPKVKELEYNFKTPAEDKAIGAGEHPGISAFIRDAEGHIFHTYSAFSRGTDGLATTVNFLDLTKLGRQDGDMASGPDKYHDEYEEEDLKGKF